MLFYAFGQVSEPDLLLEAEGTQPSSAAIRL